jgi:microsomal prostaglandin-E synthase 2
MIYLTAIIQFAVKYAGAAAMYFVSKKLKKYNSTDECASLYDAAYTWMEALNGRNFLISYLAIP